MSHISHNASFHPEQNNMQYSSSNDQHLVFAKAVLGPFLIVPNAVLILGSLIFRQSPYT